MNGTISLLHKGDQQVFWGQPMGPTVFLWESLDEEGRKACDEVVRTRTDWVVWSYEETVPGRGPGPTSPGSGRGAGGRKPQDRVSHERVGERRRVQQVAGHLGVLGQARRRIEWRREQGSACKWASVKLHVA